MSLNTTRILTGRFVHLLAFGSIWDFLFEIQMERWIFIFSMALPVLVTCSKYLLLVTSKSIITTDIRRSLRGQSWCRKLVGSCAHFHERVRNTKNTLGVVSPRLGTGLSHRGSVVDILLIQASVCQGQSNQGAVAQPSFPGITVHP